MAHEPNPTFCLFGTAQLNVWEKKKTVTQENYIKLRFQYPSVKFPCNKRTKKKVLAPMSHLRSTKKG